MIEAKLESQIIQAFSACSGSGVYFSGAWNTSQEGTVKGDEGCSADSVVAVTVSPRVMDEYDGGVAECVVSIPVYVSAAVRGELDATGSATLSLYSSVFGKAWSWVKDQASNVDTDLTVRESGAVAFAPGGVRFDGGKAPTWDSAGKCWSFSISFTVKGVTHD